jgi:hypothetical protein
MIYHTKWNTIKDITDHKFALLCIIGTNAYTWDGEETFKGYAARPAAAGGAFEFEEWEFDQAYSWNGGKNCTLASAKKFVRDLDSQ